MTSSLRLCAMQTYHILQSNSYNYWQRTSVRFMAGHSQWQNRQHLKGAKDAKRAVKTERIMKDIRIAVREGGSADPKFNRQLERAILSATKNNVPKSTIDNYLKKTDEKVVGTQSFVECRGPFTSSLIIEIFAEKIKHSRDKIQADLKRFGASIGENGTCAHNFDYKGVLYAVECGEQTLTLDEKTEIAIEVGAEDVHEEEIDGVQMTLFHTDPKELHTVKNAIPESKFIVEEAKLEYLPVNFTEIDEKQSKMIDDLYNKLEDKEYVMRIYDNLKLKGET